MSSQPDPVVHGRSNATQRRAKTTPPPIDATAFRDEFNETLAAVLNLDSWRCGRDPAEEYQRIEQEVRKAVESETDYQKKIRDKIFPLLAADPLAPPGAGVHRVTVGEIADTQRCLLFNGAVEACDGTSEPHDTLAL